MATIKDNVIGKQFYLNGIAYNKWYMHKYNTPSLFDSKANILVELTGDIIWNERMGVWLYPVRQVNESWTGNIPQHFLFPA